MTSRRPATPGLALLFMLAGLSAHAAPQISVQLGNTDGVWTASVSRGGRLALSGDKSKAFVLWDVATGRQIRAFPGAEGVLTLWNLPAAGGRRAGCPRTAADLYFEAEEALLKSSFFSSPLKRRPMFLR
jgi:hypothetical protein